MTLLLSTLIHVTAFVAVGLVVSGGATGALAVARNDDGNNSSYVEDLSHDLEEDNNNPGRGQVEAVAAANPEIRSAIVLEHGKVVASYVRDDVDPTIPFQLWSATKSWMSLLIGIMIQDNLITLDQTLGEIFTNESVWSSTMSNLTESDRVFVQDISIEELLTHTSGWLNPSPFNSSINFGPGGDVGGGSLIGSLEWPIVGGERGIFSYLGTSNILSYVIAERTGMSPREYSVATNFLASLGMNDSDVSWWQNEDGMEYSFHGLELTALQMAKFGQLYLQQGRVAPGSSMPLVSPKWIVNSTTFQVEAVVYDPSTNQSAVTEYGYLFWLWNGTKLGFSNVGSFYCASGLGGQDICVSPSLDRVSVQQGEYEGGLGSSLTMALIAFDKTLSFGSWENETETETSGRDDRLRLNLIHSLTVVACLFAEWSV